MPVFYKILKKFWGYDSFRPLQKDIIDSISEGIDTLGILPTGGGKSITFQVPGLAMEGVVIIVTPLVSLMKDQVDNLRSRGIKAVCLHSGMHHREKKLAYERIFNNKAKFLYISPERLGSENFIRDIQKLKVSFLVVDEAHCISQWGYDFRPSYLKIKKLRKLYPSAPVLALTASATPQVEADICRQLEFSANHRVFRGSIKRDNLSYIVKGSESKIFDIYQDLNNIGGSGIVYVRSRKKTREISEYLQNMGISATFYHAGLEAALKEERQLQWKEGEVRIMVATNAFGMGIDKPDVRIVIHYDMPPSLEEYYQEAGRAGRDGLPSRAILLTSPTDKAVLRRRLTMEFPPKDIIRRIYTRLCVFSHLEIGEGYDMTQEFDLPKFCRTFKIEEAVVRPSLRILGQAGYVEFIEEFENSSRLMVTVDREELYKVRLTTPIHEKILTCILRQYPGIFTDYVFINERNIAYLTQYDPQIIYEKLVELSKEKIISYIPRRKTPMLYFPTAMEEEKYIAIGRAVYEDRIEVFRNRIESMINYAFTDNNCRLKILMEYFGERSESQDCRCDYCEEKRKGRLPHLTASDLSKALRDIFKKFPGGVSEKYLSSVFGEYSDTVKEILRALHRDGEIKFENDIWVLD